MVCHEGRATASVWALAALALLAGCSSENVNTGPISAPPAGRIVINEVSTFDGDYLELYNAGDADTDVGGWLVHNWVLAPPVPLTTLLKGGTNVPPGGFLLFADDALPINLHHTGDFVQLIDDQGVVVDKVSWGDTKASPSYGRFPDGDEQLVIMTNPTPGTPNRIDVPENNPSPINLVINEVKANSPDMIELLSLESETVSLEGFWYIDSSNNPENERFVFGPGASIAPNTYVVLKDQTFGLLNNGDRVALFDPENRLVDVVEWTSGQADLSYCRVPDGTGEPVPCSMSTLGSPNVP